jgi:hypothetical protein
MRYLADRTPGAHATKLSAVRLSPEAPGKAAMFRPDPNGPHSAREAVAKLSEVLKEEPSDSPRAKKLASMIRELQNGEVKK